MKIEEGLAQVTIGELEEGMLFRYDNTIALKTEYRNDKGACECYILGSGEMFYGGTITPKKLNELIVTPIYIESE